MFCGLEYLPNILCDALLMPLHMFVLQSAKDERDRKEGGRERERMRRRKRKGEGGGGDLSRGMVFLDTESL